MAKKHLAFLDLKDTGKKHLRADALAALSVTLLGIPQGVAYATIAGLPPALGLYAGAVPAIIGSLFRSSRHVITGPTNALSLLVGGAMAVGLGEDPLVVAATLAILVGLMQVGAGALRLHRLVDAVPGAVVLGYITGAAVLIAAGQLANLTGTTKAGGTLPGQLLSWAQGLEATNGVAVALGLATTILIVGLRRLTPGLPAAAITLVAATVGSLALALPERGVGTVADLSPIPQGFPPLTLPDWEIATSLLPLALACAVLSIIESTSVGRAIAERTGQPLELSTEFIGQGLANLSAGFFGGYPVSGSLSRSVLNEKEGAQTRLAGVLSGAMVLGTLPALALFINHTPIPALAGLLFIVAWDLIDLPNIRALVARGWRQALPFGVTVLATWTLALDQAIYLGVAVGWVVGRIPSTEAP